MLDKLGQFSFFSVNAVHDQPQVRRRDTELLDQGMINIKVPEIMWNAHTIKKTVNLIIDHNG